MRLSRNGLLTAILVIAALFVGSRVTEAIPQADRLFTETPFMHEATVGETVSLRTADVTVGGVQAATSVELNGQVSATSGVWLVVDVVWSPVGEASFLAGIATAVSAADGRTFGDAQPVNNRCGPTQPGLPVWCQIAFEIDPDALEGAHILIPAGDSIYRSDDVARFDLEIDAETAAELAGTDAHVALANEVVRP